MTTHHNLTITWIGNCGSSPEDQAHHDRMLIRESAKAATDYGAVVWITEMSGWADEDDPLAAIIPASLARELIEEGRLGHPPVASMTVMAREKG